MLALHASRPHRDLAKRPAPGVKSIDEMCGQRNVGDGIQGTDLVECDIVDGDAVNLRFGLCETFKDIYRARFHPVFKALKTQQIPDVAERSVAV